MPGGSGDGVVSGVNAAAPAPAPAEPAGRLGRHWRQGVAPELEEVVGGGDEAPFGAGGVSAAAVEAVDAAIEFGLAEDGFDHGLAFAVELGAAVGREPLAHRGVGAALPAGPGALAAAGVGWDQQLDA